MSLVLALFMAVAQLSVLARKVGAASPVVMLVAGVVIAFMLGVPTISLDPDLVLLAFLPPLIYSSGVGMSWRGLRSNMRPILLMSIGCVLFTASAVAAVAHYIVGLSWALGFVLGAIVSPPDLVAPMAVLKSMRHPRRLMTVLEGESLVNDATALVTLSFALEGVASGAFSPSAAASRFLLIVVGELGFGCAVGFVMLHLRDVVADPRAEVLLALATPFLTFWPPHELGGGGGRRFLRRHGSLCLLERAKFHPAGDPPAGFFHLGSRQLVHRGARLSCLRTANAGGRRQFTGGRSAGFADLGRPDQPDSDPRSLHLGVPRHLSAAMALAALTQTRGGAKLETGLPGRLYRPAWRGQPCRGAVGSADARRRALCASRHHAVHDHLRDRGDARHSGRRLAAHRGMAGFGPCRGSRRPGEPTRRKRCAGTERRSYPRPARRG